MFRFSGILVVLSVVAMLFGVAAPSWADVVVQSALPADASALFNFNDVGGSYQEGSLNIVQTFQVGAAMTLDKLHMGVCADTPYVTDLTLELWQVDEVFDDTGPSTSLGDTLIASQIIAAYNPSFTGNAVLTWTLPSDVSLQASTGNEGYAVRMDTPGNDDNTNFLFGWRGDNQNRYAYGVGNRYDKASLGSQWDFTVALSEVPEPGALTLLSAGLIGLLAYAWRKRK